MFIDLIKMDLDSLKEEELFEPNVPLDPGDNLIGDMTLDHKKLFTLMTLTLRQSEEVKLKARFSSNESQKSLFEEFSLLTSKYDLLNDMFWFEVKLTYRDLACKPKIGVRQGYKIVWTNSSPNPLDMLRKMFE
jgi:hypothetical protein